MSGPALRAGTGPLRWVAEDAYAAADREETSSPPELFFTIPINSLDTPLIVIDYAITTVAQYTEVLMDKKPTIQELERLLNTEEDTPIQILPNGEIRAVGQASTSDLGGKKPLTMRENLGGEY